MDKQTLFELVRGEEVLLWAGAGLSLYAGYPSGQTTAKILFESFPESFKNDLDVNKPLPQFVEDYINLQRGSLNKLIRVLNNIFLSKPKSTEFHQIIASIPHFHNIITTNYDRLFELSYGSENLYTLLGGNNLAYLDKSKTNLFKIHGDLQNPDSIVVAAKDYRTYFIEKQDQIFWKHIEDLLATKAVVFIGYTLDDINILTMYERLMKSLKNHMPPAFFISPSISRAKELELSRNNITYIQQTGESFLSELLENINDNIINDVETGRTSADTFKRFMSNRSLKADLSSKKDGYNIRHLSKENGESKTNIKFNIINNKELYNKIIELSKGFGHEELTFNNDEIKGIDIRIEELKLPLSDNKEYRLTFLPLPIHESFCDFYFGDFEIEKIHTKMFKIPNGIRIFIEIYTADISFDFFLEDSNNMAVSFILKNKINNDDCISTSTKQQMDIYRFAKSVSTGVPFKFFVHKTKAMHEIHLFSESSHDIDRYIDYFSMLRNIEKAFNIKFNAFKDTDDCIEDVILLNNAITGFSEKMTWTGNVPLSSLNDLNSDKYANMIQKENVGDMKLEEIGSYHFDIHKEIIKTNIIRSFKFIDPIITKLENSNAMCVKSRDNEYMVTYSYSPYSES